MGTNWKHRKSKSSGSKRVQQALAAIAAAFHLAGLPSPTYIDQGRTTYWPALHQQVESYNRADPPTKSKLAVPITVPHHVCLVGLNSTNPQRQAIGDLTLIGFYYLLRVGEYTYTPSTQRRRTQRFRVKDVVFRRADQTIIPNTASLAELLQATHATLTITNQKNGLKGQCIHHHCTGVWTSPVKALARRVAHIMAHTHCTSTALSTYYVTGDACPKQITPTHINSTIKATVVTLGLHAYGITPSLVGTHSLRAGGAMAMILNGVQPTVVKKMGRRSSNTWMNYIHEQIDAITIGVAARMSRYIPFHNVLDSHIVPCIVIPQEDSLNTPN